MKKLTIDQLKNLESLAVRSYTPKIPKARYWTVADLAKGRMFSQEFIKKSINGANQRRKMHRYNGWNGWTKDKNMRSEFYYGEGSYLYLLIQNNPELKDKYDPDGADAHEKAKALERLKNDLPYLKTHD